MLQGEAVAADAIDPNVERDRTGDAAQGQLAVDAEAVLADRLDASADVAHRRPPFGVEEIVRQHLALPRRIAEPQRADVDLRFDRGRGGIVGVEAEGSRDSGEATHLAREAEMVGEEQHLAVDRLQPVGVGGSRGRCERRGDRDQRGQDRYEQASGRSSGNG